MSNDRGGTPSGKDRQRSGEALHSPEEMMFDANLQEFAGRVGTICALEAGGKLTPEDAYQRIKTLWKSLKHSRRSLGVGEMVNHPTE